MMKTMQLRERTNTIVGERIKSSRSEPEEVMVFCPGCKALQTVWLSDNALMPTIKYTQSENHIYHSCGTTQPCRLFFDR